MKHFSFVCVLVAVMSCLGCGKSRDNTYVHIKVVSSGEQVWCEGAVVTKSDDEGNVRWLQPWSSMDCHPSADASANCDAVIPAGRALIFQCYVARGKNTLYACNDKTAVKMEVNEPFLLVTNGQGGQNCQID